ncbi:MAG: radical SAM protein [Firmicutes bacterium]|nr:radical SAM protein [Bacillota bacterium]
MENNVEVHWEITNSCNLRCKHCINDSGIQLENELNFSEAVKAANKIKLAGVKTIYFTGGEPFSYKDFILLLGEVVKLDVRIYVISNGILIEKKDINFMKAHNISLGLSIEGSTSDINDAIRGKGNFDKTIQILSYCKKINLPTTIYSTVNKFNVNDIKNIIHLAVNYNCIGVHFNEITINGRAVTFKNDVIINTIDEKSLVEAVNEASISALNIPLKGPEKNCWVNSHSLLLTCNGNLYQCTEIKRRNPSTIIGNIKTFNLKEYLSKNKFLDYSNHMCCYWVYYNDFISLTSNSNNAACFLTTNKPIIDNLKALYNEFDKLHVDMNCDNCNYPDCKGYIWLLKNEIEELNRHNIEVLEINGKTNLIHSFDTGAGIDVCKLRPKCKYGNYKRCSIYNIRPLVCHMYPISLDSTDNGNSYVFALHYECDFIDYLKKNNELSDYICKVRNIISRISSGLYDEIKKEFINIDSISAYPTGPNNYIPICEI